MLEWVELSSLGPGQLAFVRDACLDLDLDGEPDVSETYNPASPMKVQWTFGGAGDYKVTMTMTDAVYKEKYSVTRTIHVKDLDAKEGGAK